MVVVAVVNWVDKVPSRVWNWASDRTTPPVAVIIAGGFDDGVGGKNAGLFGSVGDQADGDLGGLLP